jgi:hypothetical protein
MGIGLRINQSKARYMAMNARRLLDPHVLETGPYTFEHVDYIPLPIWVKKLIRKMI